MDSDDIKELTQSWYDVLKNSGFQDAEQTTHPSRPLKQWHSFKWRNTPHEKIKQTQDYYQQARALLHTYHFKNEIHQIIWELHSEGHSTRQIEQTIAHLPKAVKQFQIGLIIAQIAKSI